MAGVWALYDDPHDAIGSLSKARLVVRQFASRMSSVWEKLTELNLLPFTSYFSGQGFNRLLVVVKDAGETVCKQSLHRRVGPCASVHTPPTFEILVRRGCELACDADARGDVGRLVQEGRPREDGRGGARRGR